MNLAIGTLLFAGLTLIILGILSGIFGLSILSPYIVTTYGYFIAGNTCLLLALVVDKFEK